MAKVGTSNPDRTISLKAAVRKLKIIIIIIIIIIIDSYSLQYNF